MSLSLSLVTLRGRCRGGPPGAKSPLGQPELIDIYNAIGQWLLQNAQTGNRVDVFALEPFAGYRDALVEYLGMHAGRVKVLNSAGRLHCSDPANRTFTFPGYDGNAAMHLCFPPNNIRLYGRLYRAFRPQLDSFNVEEIQKLRGLLVLEIKYLRGCDSQWIPEPAGKFSSLAMLQGKALTARVRAGAAGGSKQSGDESSSSFDIVGVKQLPPVGAAALRVGSWKGGKASENGYIGASQSSPEGESQARLLASCSLHLFCSRSLPRLLLTLVLRRWSSLRRPRRPQSFHQQECLRSRIRR